MIEKSDVFVSIDGVLSCGKTKDTSSAGFRWEWLFILIMREVMPLSIILQLEFRLFLGRLIEKNTKKYPVIALIYDDEIFEKNIISIEIMPNGRLKMLNRNYNYQIDFGNIRYGAKI
jgi:cell division protein FtsQ